MKATAFMMVLSLVLLSTAAIADVPSLISYQGTLTDEYGVALDTTVSMTFRIYTDSTGGKQVWIEYQPSVPVNQGIFNVLLGSVNAISDTVFKSPSRWLGITVFDEGEMVPRQQIAAVGYAFQAAIADTAAYAHNAPAVSDGDWTIAGNNMYSAVPGSVGIGTTTPLAHLHVGSDVNTELRIEHGDWKNTLAFYRHGDPAGYIVKDDDTRRLRISAGDSTDHLTIVESDGYVGIGTTTPASRLEVAGTVHSTSGGFKFPDGSTQTSASAGDGHSLDADDGSPTDALYVDANGDVGIGTASPAAKLDVKGAVKVASDYRIGQNTVLSVPNTVNTFVGVGAGESNTGTPGTFIGYRAGRVNEGSDNTFVGAAAGSSNADGYWNTFIGQQAGQLNSGGASNTFVGSDAGKSNALGHDNTFLGAGAGLNSTTHANTFVGSGAGYSTTTGGGNVYIGNDAGYLNTTGGGNVFIGQMAGRDETGSDLLYISNSSLYALIWGDFSLSNRMVVIAGDSSDNTNDRTFFVNGDAGGWTGWFNDSDGHLKKEIRTIPQALHKVQKLHGVNFKWRDAENRSPGRQMGFVAQEAVKVIPEVVGGEDGHYTMQYGPITALLVEAIKEQQGIIDDLKARIEILEAANRSR